MAGFEVIIYGRFCVITEDDAGIVGQGSPLSGSISQ
jgi:hypothetical protein